jgi:hypothetical protein
MSETSQTIDDLTGRLADLLSEGGIRRVCTAGKKLAVPGDANFSHVGRLAVPLSGCHRTICDFLEENHCSGLTRESVARTFGITPNYLSNLFRKSSGERWNQGDRHPSFGCGSVPKARPLGADHHATLSIGCRSLRRQHGLWSFVESLALSVFL